MRGCNLLLKTSSFRVEPSLLMGDFTPSISSSSITLPDLFSDFCEIPSGPGDVRCFVETRTERELFCLSSFFFLFGKPEQKNTCHSLKHSRTRGGHRFVAVKPVYRWRWCFPTICTRRAINEYTCAGRA